MKQSTYKINPITKIKGIPVFCNADAYTEIYETISQDHLDAVTVDMENPFIANEVWEEIEKNTVDALARNVKDGDKVLDVGIGTGRLFQHFPHAEKYGIDVSINYLERLAGSDIEVCMGSVENLPYLDSFFDVIVCTDVLEHVIELSTAISEITRVLKKDGTLIVRVPYKEDLTQYLAQDFPYKYAHLRIFDEASLEIMFCRVFNFSIQEKMMDYSLYPDALKAKQFFLGRGLFVRMLRDLTKVMPSCKQEIMSLLFNPIEITMVFRLNKPE